MKNHFTDPFFRLPLVILFCLALFLSLPAQSFAAASKAPGKSELSGANLYMKRFEKHVKRMNGKPFPLAYDDKEALKRIKKLKEKYPDAPEVEELFQRARQALMASKGNYFQITPEMLAYRDQEKILVKNLGELADAEWKSLMEKAHSSSKLKVLEKPFPSPDPEESDPEDIIGSYVILDDIRYPDNEFRDMGGQYLFMGSGTKGYYFLKLSDRSWLGPYEALKRYRRQVSQDTPIPWTVLGRIETVTILVPQAGKEKTKEAAVGWLVEPKALYVPHRVLALADSKHELGGEYVGEKKLETIKKGMYTYTEVPEDVEPMKLVEIFATAIKEKNWNLYLECIDPARQKTPTAIKRLQYFYDNNLERYVRWYVYVQPVKAKPIEVIKGEVVEEGSTEDFFLSDDQKNTIADRTQELVEQVMVVIRTYDEHGKQTSMPKDVTLRRYNGGRWYIAAGYPL